MLRRWMGRVLLALGVMGLDLLGLIGVTRAFLPHKPPPWATAPFFWLLAWPVPIFARLFPQPGGSADRGPSLLAVGLSGLVDIVLLTLLCDRILRHRRTTTPTI